MAVELSERVCKQCEQPITLPKWRPGICPRCVSAQGKPALQAARARRREEREQQERHDMLATIFPAAADPAPIPTLINIGALGSTAQQELQAMATIAQVLDALPRKMQLRVMAWVYDRLAQEEAV